MTTPTLSYLPAEKRGSIGEVLSRLGPVLGLVLVLVVFGVWKPADFLTLDNFTMIFYLTTVVATAALGMTLIIITGGIDLSAGSSIALVGVVVAQLLCYVSTSQSAAVDKELGRLLFAPAMGRFYNNTLVYEAPGWAWATAGALGGITIAAVTGFVVGQFITRLKLAPFIVTLGMWSALRGIALSMANDTMVRCPPTWINTLLKSKLVPEVPEHATFGFHVQRVLFWIVHLPYAVWMTAVLAVLVALMLRYTRFGRHIYAVGSNEGTARLCGVRVNRVKVLVYTLAGVFFGVAGLLQYSLLKMGDPTTANGKELNVIAAVVVGGASLSGGRGSILGTIIGALIMAVVENGCNVAGIPNSRQQIVTGAIIIVAVAADQLRKWSRE
jgi:ribose/xylose/arabinose/galactoside ABC-type transport system permease subunit